MPPWNDHKLRILSFSRKANSQYSKMYEVNSKCVKPGSICTAEVRTNTWSLNKCQISRDTARRDHHSGPRTTKCMLTRHLPPTVNLPGKSNLFLVLRDRCAKWSNIRSEKTSLMGARMERMHHETRVSWYLRFTTRVVPLRGTESTQKTILNGPQVWGVPLFTSTLRKQI